jgi:heptosyltransferase III
MAKPARFLILRGGAIGDFIVTLPALAAIRERWPDAHIELIGYPHIARLALQNNLVNHVRSLDEAGMAAFFGSRPLFTPDQVDYIRSFDLVFSWLHDFDGTVKTNLTLAGARQVVYGSPLIPDHTHAADHLFKPLEQLALYTDWALPRLHLNADTIQTAQDYLRQRQLKPPCWAIHPGSGSRKKNWPLAHFQACATFLTQHGITPLYILGEADEHEQRLLEPVVPPAQLLTGLPLTEIAGILSQCQGFLGNDSGITHIAAALDCPVITLFGPSNPAQWAPRGPRVRVLVAPENDWHQLPPENVIRHICNQLDLC